MTRELQTETPDELELLLPFYVNGTLDSETCARIDAALETDDRLAHSLALLMEDQGEAVAMANAIPAPASMETRFLAQLDSEIARAKSQATVADHQKAGIFSAIGQWLQDSFALMTPQRLGVAGAVAALVIAVQAGYIATTVTGDKPATGSTYQTASGDAQSGETGPAVLVQFTPGASMADLSAFLEAEKGMIVDGPLPGGFFKLRFDETEGRTTETVLEQVRTRNDLFTLSLPSE
ncbi:hypothetical protein [Coralliovum pocilloporae]|uniref:hypothetical protein n=1 Tax=Coralliovum pocilloporae TaxID=3066369 RepID=UPI00330785C3